MGAGGLLRAGQRLSELMSLRFKLTFIVLLVATIGNTIFITLWQPWSLDKAVARQHETQQAHLISLGDGLTPYLLQGQIGAVYEILDTTLERQTDWKSLELHDADGVLLYPLDATPLADAPALLRLAQAIELRNQPLGRLDLVADLSSLIADQRRQTWLLVGVSTLGFLLLAAIISVLLDITIGRRTRQLVRAVEQVAHGDFTSDLPLRDKDEIGQLAQAVDMMRQAIEAEEASLRQARLAAEASNRAKSTFLATMSHEIRTPMNGVLGMAQMLLMPNISEDDRQDYARTILNSGQTLLILLNDILDLSKVEAGKLELDVAAFEPRQILHETKSLFLEAAHKKGLALEIAWSGPTSGRYRGDPHRLRQMLSNLVGNAIKFTQQGSVHIDAHEVESDGEECLLEFSVSDTGIGIPEDKQHLLFQPFSQTDSSTTRQYGGTGLGLSIVRSLAKLMGGEVGVDSNFNEGSRFWFRVRQGVIRKGEDSRDTVRPGNRAEQAECKSTRLTGRVLVVEDNPTNRKVIEAILEKFGLAATMAEDGQRGIEILQRDAPFDLVLMDIQMPVLDGYAATSWIRQWEAEGNRPHLPIIALTADAFEEDKKHCLAVGMDDFLAKPILVDAVRSVLRRWLKPEVETSPVSPPQPTLNQAVDVIRINAILEELLPLLAENKFDAIGRFKALQDCLAQTSVAGEVADAGQPLSDLRFDITLERLRRIAQKQGWATETL
jgi:signal transduction histidine kinase/DNA-binding NarL/FixJ family response regulator